MSLNYTNNHVLYLFFSKIIQNLTDLIFNLFPNRSNYRLAKEVIYY